MLDYKIKHQDYIIFLWCVMLSLMKRKTFRISGEMLPVLNTLSAQSVLSLGQKV